MEAAASRPTRPPTTTTTIGEGLATRAVIRKERHQRRPRRRGRAGPEPAASANRRGERGAQPAPWPGGALEREQCAQLLRSINTGLPYLYRALHKLCSFVSYLNLCRGHRSKAKGAISITKGANVGRSSKSSRAAGRSARGLHDDGRAACLPLGSLRPTPEVAALRACVCITVAVIRWPPRGRPSTGHKAPRG